MSALRGFGFTHDNGVVRHWYIGSDGVKRWVAGDKPVNEVPPAVMSGGCAIKERLEADFSRLFSPPAPTCDPRQVKETCTHVGAGSNNKESSS